MKKPNEYAVAACRAHTDLNVFHGVIALMEGGLLSSDSYPGAERIIAICRKEAEKCLGRYDRALVRAGRTLPRADRSIAEGK